MNTSEGAAVPPLAGAELSDLRGSIGSGKESKEKVLVSHGLTEIFQGVYYKDYYKT